MCECIHNPCSSMHTLSSLPRSFHFLLQESARRRVRTKPRRRSLALRAERQEEALGRGSGTRGNIGKKKRKKVADYEGLYLLAGYLFFFFISSVS